jgi:hypothetical protein
MTVQEKCDEKKQGRELTTRVGFTNEGWELGEMLTSVKSGKYASWSFDRARCAFAAAHSFAKDANEWGTRHRTYIAI